MTQLAVCSRMRSRRALLVAALATVSACALSSSTDAADVGSTWFGGSGAWNDAANWVNAPVVAQYPSNGNGGLTYDATVAAGTATLAGNIALQNSNMASGSLAGTGDLNVSSSAWTGGTVFGAGTLAASSTISISGTGSRTLGTRNLTNGGVLTWTGTTGCSAAGPSPTRSARPSIVRMTASAATRSGRAASSTTDCSRRPREPKRASAAVR